MNKTTKIILWVILGIFAINWLNKHKKAAKGDPFDPLNLVPINSVEWHEISEGFGDSIGDSRKKELSGITEDIYSSMTGAFMRKQDFIGSMLKINSDVEFQFVETLFGKRKNKGLKQWIEKELLVTASVKRQINTEYQLKGMITKI